MSHDKRSSNQKHLSPLFIRVSYIFRSIPSTWLAMHIRFCLYTPLLGLPPVTHSPRNHRYPNIPATETGHCLQHHCVAIAKRLCHFLRSQRRARHRSDLATQAFKILHSDTGVCVVNSVSRGGGGEMADVLLNEHIFFSNEMRQYWIEGFWH